MQTAPADVETSTVTLSAARDGGWLRQFGLEPTEEVLDELQCLIDEDAVDLSHAKGAAREKALPIRKAFFDRLGLSQSFEKAGVSIAGIGHAIEVLRTLDEFGVDVRHVVYRNPRIVAHDPDALRKKVVTLNQLGLRTTNVINSEPTVLNLAPEHMRDKAAGLVKLALNPAVVINARPQTATNSLEKILLTACVCKQAGIWDDVREKWNRGESLDLLATPVESLLLHCGLEPDDFKANPFRSRRFVRGFGIDTGAERKATLRGALGIDGDEMDEGLVRNLGFVAFSYHSVERGRMGLTPNS